MSPAMKKYRGIGSDACVKAKCPMTLMMARGLLLSEWGQDISQRRRLPFLVLGMVRKAVIGGVI